MPSSIKIMAKRCCKPKGRKQNGQPQKVDMLRGGRVVKATATRMTIKTRRRR